MTMMVVGQSPLFDGRCPGRRQGRQGFSGCCPIAPVWRPQFCPVTVLIPFKCTSADHAWCPRPGIWRGTFPRGSLVACRLPAPTAAPEQAPWSWLLPHLWADARGRCNSDLSSRHPLTALESRRGLAPAYPALHIDSVVSSDNLPPRGSGMSHHTLLAPMCPDLAPLCPLRVGLPTYSLQGTGGVPGPSRAALMSGYTPLLPATERSIYFFKLKREEIDFAFIIS